jgi:aspartate/methionine/tyrosine aminotransferase
VEKLTSAGSFLDGGPSHPLQRAALPLLQRDHADAEAKAIQTAFSVKRHLVIERLRGMGIGLEALPAGSFYAFASLDDLPPALRNGMDFFRAALREKVIVVPGEFFDVNPGQRRGHIPSRLRQFVRISFGPSLDTVRTGLDRLDRMISAG